MEKAFRVNLPVCAPIYQKITTYVQAVQWLQEKREKLSQDGGRWMVPTCGHGSNLLLFYSWWIGLVFLMFVRIAEGLSSHNKCDVSNQDYYNNLCSIVFALCLISCESLGSNWVQTVNDVEVQKSKLWKRVRGHRKKKTPTFYFQETLLQFCKLDKILIPLGPGASCNVLA